jgi:pyridoxal phosphate enzyme (YggS family)
MRLLEKINEEAKKIDKVINCLLQIHIAEEDTKFGFSKDELLHILTSPEYSSLQNIRICGMMGMASLTNNQIQIEKEFGYIDSLFKAIKENFFKDQHEFKELSIGMSGDYHLAIKHGSTMVRIGTGIFGKRNY